MKFKKLVTTVLAAAMVVTSLPTSAMAVGAPNLQAVEQTSKKASKKQAYAEGQAIVLFNKQYTKAAKKNAVKAMSLAKGVKVTSMWDFSNSTGKVSTTGKSGIAFGDTVVAVVKSDKMTTEQLIKELKKNPYVEMVEPNYKCQATATPDYSGYQWALDNKGQNGGKEGADINADAIWSKGITGTDKVIAVVDTGIDYTNDDLKNVLWTNPYQARLAGEHGYDFVNYDADPLDDNGHGSHCSGIIAASTENPQAGIQGVNQKASIMALKFLDEEGSGWLEGAIGAYNYIYQAQCLGINVVAVNNSWGTIESSIFDVLMTKVGEKGAVSCCAAGNSAENNDKGYDLLDINTNPYIITVAATNENDELADFSCYGKETVTLGAPGTDILSTVSYNSFNPTIYDSAKLDALCGAAHTDYENTTVNPYTVVAEAGKNPKDAVEATQEFGVPSMMIASVDDEEVDKTAKLEAKTDNKVFFGKADGKSLQIKASDVKKGDFVTVVIPFTKAEAEIAPTLSYMFKTAGPAATEKEVYYGEEYTLCSSMSIGLINEKEYKAAAKTNFTTVPLMYYIELDGETNYWDHLTMELDKKAGTEYLVFQFDASYDGDYTLWLDDVAATKGVKNESKDFGKHDFFNGTSMATPYVTGSVALLSSIYADATADELVAITSSSIRKVDGLKDVTKTGGVLDLSFYNNPVPVINSVELGENNKFIIKGFGLKAGSIVKVDGTQVNASFDTSGKSITIDGANYYNKKITISVSNDRGDSAKSILIGDGKEITKLGSFRELLEMDLISTEPQTLTDGKNLLVVDASMYGDVNINTVNVMATEDSYVPMLAGSTYTSFIDLFDNYDSEYQTTALEGNAVYLDGSVYMIIALKDNLTQYKDYKFVKVDPLTGEYVILKDIPEEYNTVSIGTLAAYNGDILIVGGYDYTKKDLSTLVMKYDTAADEWSKGIALPDGQGRDLATITQAGDKLVCSLGAAKIKDGKSACPKNLIFDGTKWTVSNATLNVIEPDEYIYLNDEKIHVYKAATGLSKKGILYVGLDAYDLGDAYEYNVSKDAFEKTGYKYSDSYGEDALVGTVVNDTFVGLDYDSMNYDFALSVMPVDSGLVKVKLDSKKKATLEAEEGYLPGSMVTVRVIPKKGYAVKSVKVNGATTKGNKVTFRIGKTTTISAKYGKGVKTLKLNKKTATLKVGSKLKLKAIITPKKALNKAVKWKSSNKKYATVSKKGVVTALKAGKGKTVTITCKTKDGSSFVAKCKIKIK